MVNIPLPVIQKLLWKQKFFKLQLTEFKINRKSSGLPKAQPNPSIKNGARKICLLKENCIIPLRTNFF